MRTSQTFWLCLLLLSSHLLRAEDTKSPAKVEVNKAEGEASRSYRQILQDNLPEIFLGGLMLDTTARHLRNRYVRYGDQVARQQAIERNLYVPPTSLQECRRTLEVLSRPISNVENQMRAVPLFPGVRHQPRVIRNDRDLITYLTEQFSNSDEQRALNLRIMQIDAIEDPVERAILTDRFLEDLAQQLASSTRRKKEMEQIFEDYYRQQMQAQLAPEGAFTRQYGIVYESVITDILFGQIGAGLAGGFRAIVGRSELLAHRFPRVKNLLLRIDQSFMWVARQVSGTSGQYVFFILPWRYPIYAGDRVRYQIFNHIISLVPSTAQSNSLWLMAYTLWQAQQNQEKHKKAVAEEKNKLEVDQAIDSEKLATENRNSVEKAFRDLSKEVIEAHFPHALFKQIYPIEYNQAWNRTPGLGKDLVYTVAGEELFTFKSLGQNPIESATQVQVVENHKKRFQQLIEIEFKKQERMQSVQSINPIAPQAVIVGQVMEEPAILQGPFVYAITKALLREIIQSKGSLRDQFSIAEKAFLENIENDQIVSPKDTYLDVLTRQFLNELSPQS